MKTLTLSALFLGLSTAFSVQAQLVPANDVGMSVVGTGPSILGTLAPAGNGGVTCPTGPTAAAFSGANSQLGRIFRDGIPSECPTKAYPGIFNAATTFNFETFTYSNTGAAAACVTVNFDPNTGATPCGTNAHASAYIGAYDPANQATNFVGDVGSSVTQPFSFEVPAGQNMVLVVTNTASAAVCNFAFEVVDLPCQAGSADLSLTFSGSPNPVAPGGTLTYTAVATNNGPTDADTVEISIDLPAGVSFVSSSASPGGACAGSDPVVCTWGTTVTGGVRTATAVVTAPATLGALAASATVSSATVDPVPGNNAATSSINVAVPPPAFIPTGTHYGLGLLALLLGTIGFVAVRRRA